MNDPRIPPLTDEQASEEARLQMTRAALSGNIYNVFRTLAHHPDLLRRWLVFATHVLSKSTLSDRDREIAILRTAWLCRSEYEWGQHVQIGRRCGLDDEAIRGIADGGDGLAEDDGLLVKATDELVEDHCLSDSVWQELERRYERQQIMDLVFCVGQYAMLAGALRSFGVQLDEGIAGFEETVGRRPD